MVTNNISNNNKYFYITNLYKVSIPLQQREFKAFRVMTKDIFGPKISPSFQTPNKKQGPPWKSDLDLEIAFKVKFTIK